MSAVSSASATAHHHGSQLSSSSSNMQHTSSVSSYEPTTSTKPHTKSPHQTKTTTTADMSRRMVCGGIAGMVAKTVTNPLERIKMLSQTGEHGAENTSIRNIYRSILQHEGITGLWAGNGVNLLRVFPSKAVIFSTNDWYKAMWRRVTGIHDEQQSLPAQYSFLAGGMAGMTATAATYPLDFARGRISGKMATVGSATASATGQAHQKVYAGILQTLAVTVKDEGFFALYKGMTPTLLGAMPYCGIQFGTVGLLERLFPVHNKNNSDNTTTASENSKPSPLRKMMFGGMGGVTAGLITYPNDTVRRMLQLQGSRGTAAVYTGYWDCVRQIVSQHGVARLYRGLTVNLIRMAPNTAVQFGSYELLKQLTADWSF